MIVKRIRARRANGLADFAINDVDPSLNIVVGDGCALADLAAHLLYGDHEFHGDRANMLEGELNVQNASGNYRLRRRREGTEWRLTIDSTDSDPTGRDTVNQLLHGLPPHRARRLFAIDFTRGSSAADLLDEHFVQLFAKQDQYKTSIGASVAREAWLPRICDLHRPTQAVADAAPSDNVDELVCRRDALTLQIEELLGRARSSSAELESRLTEASAELGRLRNRLHSWQTELSQVNGELADAELRLRYFSLDRELQPNLSASPHAAEREITRIDDDIAECRQVLENLRNREAAARHDLAQARPDGTASAESSLIDQRATLSVLEQLLGDLDAEVSQLARTHEPGICPGIESHARIAPLANLLRQQVYTMCGQLSEQERVERRRVLVGELRQLERAQTDLSERLESLLARRQQMVHEQQIVVRPTLMVPQAPAGDCCRCEEHDQFVRENEAMVIARPERSSMHVMAESQRQELLGRQRALRNSIDNVQSEIARLESESLGLQSDRGKLVQQTQIDELRAELKRIEAAIQQTLGSQHSFAAQLQTNKQRFWKASDLLAQLTGGRLVELRFNREARTARVVDRLGQSHSLGDLSASEGDLVFLSLALSLAAERAASGTSLPIILREPFARQDKDASAVMAGVLDRCAHAGLQIFVFTEKEIAVARFQSFGAAVHRLDEGSLQRRKPEQNAQLSAETPPAVSALRLVRTVADDPNLSNGVNETAAEFSAVVDSDGYYLRETDDIAQFPVLGVDSASSFAELKIRTVGDLLFADAADVAQRLSLPNITARVVQLWQSHIALMCYVAETSLQDAQILSGAGVSGPEGMAGIELDALHVMLGEFFDSQRGRQFSDVRSRYSNDRLVRWQSSARNARSRWRNWRTGRRSKTNKSLPLRSSSGSTTVRKKRRSRARDDRPLRFLLAMENPVVDAPSIGEKAAEKLASVGIRTVADLLNADAESTAQEIGRPYFTQQRIASWQRQAALVCQIPELRGYGAQLLVACDYTEPQQIAESPTDELTKTIRRFCRTKEGQRILRNGKTPSSAKISEWIDNARRSRPLEAA